eukprot:g57098.t1
MLKLQHWKEFDCNPLFVRSVSGAAFAFATQSSSSSDHIKLAFVVVKTGANATRGDTCQPATCLVYACKPKPAFRLLHIPSGKQKNEKWEEIKSLSRGFQKTISNSQPHAFKPKPAFRLLHIPSGKQKHEKMGRDQEDFKRLSSVFVDRKLEKLVKG